MLPSMLCNDENQQTQGKKNKTKWLKSTNYKTQGRNPLNLLKCKLLVS